MKTRFTQLLKVKKQKLQEVENQLLDVREKKSRIKREIAKLDQQIKDLEIPKGGDFSLLQLQRNSFEMLLQKEQELKERLEVRKRQIIELKKLYKESNIEYEKVLYLHEDEIKRELEEIKVKESKQMDEIANILFQKSNKRMEN